MEKSRFLFKLWVSALLCMLVIFGVASHSDAVGQSSFTQCANDDAAGSKNDGAFDQCEWITGAITQINSKYAESDAVPQRFIFVHTAPAGGGDHTAVFRYDFTKSSVYTYDFVVDPNHSMQEALLNHCGNMPPFATLEQCETALGGPSLSNMQFIPLPVDTFDSVSTKEHPPGGNARFIHFACVNIDDVNNPVAVVAPNCTANVVSIVHKQANGSPIPGGTCFKNCGDSIAEISIHFTHPAGNHLIEMWFAGELASAADPDGAGPQSGWGTGCNGTDCGASSAPGASFDFRLVNIDGDAAGAKTNQIMNSVIEQGHDSDLAIDKTCPANIVAGNDISYTIHVTNNGPHSATGVYISDALPAGVTFVSATASQSIVPCTYDGGTNSVFCDVGFVQVGQEVSVTIVVTVPAGTAGGTVLSNTATTGGAVNDPTLANNTDTCNTTVGAQTGNANLSVDKSDGPDPVLAGNQLTYTLLISNAGPDDATSVVLTDSLPSVTTFVSSVPGSPTCTESNHLVTCNLGTILNGGSATVTIVVIVDPTVRGTITNVATVSSAVSDPTPGNNSDTEDTLVNGAADLSITKTDSPDPVPAGSTLNYTLTVSNAGPSSALNTQVLDTLPAGVSFISAIASKGTGCNFDLVNTITCDLGTILPGGSATITISVQVSSSLPVGTNLVNTATVHSDETDPDQGNNTATATTQTTAPLPPVSVPTMTEWGLISFMLFAGAGSVYYLRRKRIG